MTLVMSVNMEQHDSHQSDFRNISYLGFWIKSVETFPFGLKLRKKITESFTLRPTYSYAIGFCNGDRLLSSVKYEPTIQETNDNTNISPVTS